MRFVSRLTCAVATVLLACSRAAPGGNGAPPASSAPARAATATPTDGTPTASARGAAAATTPDAAAVVPAVAAGASEPADPADAALRWSASLTAHDADALRRLYGPRVLLYGKWMSRDAAVAAKAASFAATPDYAQSIGRIDVDDQEFPVRPLVTFRKRWTAGHREREVDASLVVARERGAWRVVEESDAKTRGAESCLSLVTAVVASTNEAKALLNGPLDPANGHVANGMRYGENEEDLTYSVGVFEDHADHLAMLEWFHVDPRTGAVTEDVPDAAALRTDPALTSQVATDCWTEP